MRVTTWYEALYRCQSQGQSYVLVTVLQTAGSTPRDAGTKMLITDAEQYDTIGGGHLEYAATAQARELLVKGQHIQHIESFPLSSKLGQCCGGAVKLLFEVFVEHHQHIAVYGAGHVAAALVPILAQLPVQISWIDSRAALFNRIGAECNSAEQFSQNVACIVNDDPSETLAQLPSGTWIIILTHNHQLDYELVETALKLGHIDFIGMIGSQTKAKRFVTRLAHREFCETQIARLVSPIGLPNIPGKRPIEVAVSISAQIIQKLNDGEHQHTTSNTIARPLTVKEPEAS
jgi:xanthine dehydrogenase accessory factor